LGGKKAQTEDYEIEKLEIGVIKFQDKKIQKKQKKVDDIN